MLLCYVFDIQYTIYAVIYAPSGRFWLAERLWAMLGFSCGSCFFFFSGLGGSVRDDSDQELRGSKLAAD